MTIFSGSSSAVTLPFSVAWESNTEDDLSFYTVYHGTSSGNYDHSKNVSAPNTALLFDKNYFASKGITIGPEGLNLYIALSASDSSQNESDLSATVSVFIEPPTTSTTSTTPATTTSSVPPDQQEFCNTDPFLKFRGKTPKNSLQIFCL